MNLRKIIYVFLFLIISTFCWSQSESYKYAIAILNTPVLNTSDFESVFGGNNGKSVKLDKRGLIGEMEFIAFPNTVFQIQEVIPKGDHNIFKITTDDYPYNSGDLFIDSRFVKLVDTLPNDRELILPDKAQILEKLNSLDGYAYMWGGNYGDGVEQLLEFYQPSSEPDEYFRNLWALKGVDCSGLIYQATNGSTPRNTSTLITYGEGIQIAGKSASQIAAMLKPLDLIVWSGHVIIVYDDNTVIESTGDAGVHKSDLTARLRSIMKEKTPVNDWGSTSGKRFVVRRWYDQ